MKKVHEVMHADVWTASERLSVQELAHELTSRRISGAPVVDQAGNMVGVVSLSDVAAHLAHSQGQVHRGHWGRYWDTGMLDDDLLNSFSLEDYSGQGQVRDIMTPAVYTIAADADLVELADMLLNGQIHRALVTRGDKLVGIATATDLVRELREMLLVVRR